MRYYDKAVTIILAGKNRTDKQNKTEIERARIIKRTLGTKVAARYMFNRNWSIEAALYILCGRVA